MEAPGAVNRDKTSWRWVAETRFDGLFALLLVLALAVVARLLWVQWVMGDELRKQGDLVYSEEVLEPSRGNILADDGRLLATSLPMFRLHMDMVPVRSEGRLRRRADSLFEADIDSLGLCLSTIFPERSASGWVRELRQAKAQGNRYYRLGSRDVSYGELRRLREFPFFRAGRARSGLIVDEFYRRVTLMDDLARRTVGWRSSTGNWVGLEDYFNQELKGENGLRIMQRAANNRRIPVSTEEHVPPVQGSDVETTLDVNLQDVAARALRRKLEEHQAEKGTVVVMEVKTGAVKAMVNLARTPGGQYLEQRNIAVGESTNPGSTFKLATLIALLEDGLVDLEDSVNTGDGVWRRFGHDFRDAKRGGHGKLSVSQVWELSSNVGVVQLLYDRYGGKERQFLDRLFGMRLNQPLGVSLRGEGKPYIRVPGDAGWSGISLGQIGIGYEVYQTPLQVLAFYNAVANDGCYVRPYLVRALWRDGVCIKEFGPVVLQRSICSRGTLRKVRGVLERVVEQGTAMNLRAAHYRIAGKTGTAQMEHGSEGYQKGSGAMAYQSSFVGYFPAESPRYSCIVVVYSPSSKGYYGNTVAGPIFREIADKVYATRREWFPHCESGPSGELLASKPGHRASLARVFSELGYRVEDESGGSFWVNTVRGDNGRVQLGARQYGVGVVPDVVGLSLQDAVYIVENAGYRVQVYGRGSVRSQSETPHARLPKGRTVKLEMSIQ